MGWAGLSNGESLAQVSGFAAFVPADRGIEYQQNLSTLSFGVVLLTAGSNRLDAYLPLADALATAVTQVKPGELIKVAA